jgi:hypothetical protein
MAPKPSRLGLSDSVAQKARQFVKRSAGSFPAIAEFVTSPAGLNQSIFPSQRFFLKVFEKEELDATVEDIEIRDKFNEKVLYRLSERGYYDFMRSEGRFSLDYETYCASETVQLLLLMGRRASKSTMVGMWIATKLGQLLMHDRPQDYFGIVTSDRMNVSLTALGEDNAVKLFGKLASLIKAAPYFKPYLLEPPASASMKIWTRHDLDTLREKRLKSDDAHTNSINITAQANTPGVRGDNNIFCVLEEFCHFNQSKSAQKGEKQLDERIYESLAPSVSGFRGPDGRAYGKTLIISSPNGQVGKGYFEYENAFNAGADSYSLAMAAPTWEVNPLVGSAFLKKEYRSSPSTYDQEYGAKILSGGMAWLRDLGAFYAAPIKDAPMEPPVGRIDRTYYCGIDFALSNDATAVAICHYEPFYRDNPDEYIPEAFAYNPGQDWVETETPRGVYVVDYVGERFAGKPPFENQSTLLIDDVLDWIEYLFKVWPIAGGVYDQWSGELIRQLIEKRGMGRKLTMLNMTEAANDSLAKLFSECLHDRRLKIPGYKPLLQNLLRLQVEHRPRNIVKIEAPAGGHDDDYDAISRALWMCHSAVNRNFVLGGNKVDVRLGPAVEGGLSFSQVRDERSYRAVQDKIHQTGMGLRNPKALMNRMNAMGPGFRR